MTNNQDEKEFGLTRFSLTTKAQREETKDNKNITMPFDWLRQRKANKLMEKARINAPQAVP